MFAKCEERLAETERNTSVSRVRIRDLLMSQHSELETTTQTEMFEADIVVALVAAVVAAGTWVKRPEEVRNYDFFFRGQNVRTGLPIHSCN